MASARVWTIRFRENGRPAQHPPCTAAEARACLGFLLAEDPGAVIVALAAELAARYPVGARVRNTGSGSEGTIVARAASGSHLQRRPGAVIHFQIDHRGRGQVCVLLDRKSWPDWFMAEWIEPITDTRRQARVAAE